MKKLFLTLLFQLGLVEVALAGNIAIVDQGGDIAYTNSISSRVISKRCYSENDVRKTTPREIGQDVDIRYFYQYKTASGCPNATAYQLSVGERYIADRNTVSSGDVIVKLQNKHLSDMSYTALQYTSQKVSLISTGSFYPIENSAFEYVSTAVLESRSSLFDVVNALNHVINNRVSHNIRVLNISMGGGVYHEGTGSCDNILGGLHAEIKSKLQLLRQNGVAIVAAAGNTHPFDAQNATAFPACLSSVISVGGYYRSGIYGYLYGAISLSHTYVEQISYGTFGNRAITGTSPAAAKISGYISELMAINPLLSTQSILNILYSSADNTSRLYWPNTNRTKYTNNRKTPNFTNAKAAVKSDATYNQYLDLLENTADTGSYGSQFGSNVHPNGLRILFKTTTSSPISAKSFSAKNVISNASTQKTYYRLRLLAYDVDTTDEIEVFLNSASRGYLPKTANNSLSGYIDYYFEEGTLFTTKSNIVTLKQKNSGERWGAKNISITKITAGVCDIVPVEDNNQTIIAGSATVNGDEISYSDSQLHNFCNGSQRYYYNFNIAFDSSSSTATPPTRDVVLSFDATTTSGISNGFEIEVNGTLIKTISNFSGSNNVSQVINRKHFINGTNTITLKPSNDTPSQAQELNIDNLTAQFIPAVSVNLGQTYTQLYGYSQSPSRYTGLRLKLNLSAINDLSMTVKGWDIDRSDETSIYVNNIYYGQLSQSLANNGYNLGNTFSIQRNHLSLGINRIEFVQRYPDGAWTGFEDEKWAVKDIRINKLLPDLSVSAFKKVSNGLVVANTPFSLATTITNIGAGSSGANTLKYYASEDRTINANDQLLTSSSFGSISQGSSINITKTVSVNSTQEKYYIGVCIPSIETETSFSNNCSAGIKISNMTIAPIIMLLLQ